MTRSWLDLPADTPFGVDNLPYGVFSTPDEEPRIGVAIGDQVLDLAPVAANEGLDGAQVFEAPSLNPFMALGRPAWHAVRQWLTELVTHPSYADLVEPHLVSAADVRLHLPFEVADYVDFYASEHHASNVGQIFRPGSEPLTPNWKHLPIGYHGRAGTIVGSGTDIVRPSGQRKAPDAAAPTFGPSARLDIEAEVAYVIGVPTAMGRGVTVDDFAEHVFGVCLLNDWSARDIQAWEYVPLGPFLGKSFATSVSPWVVPLEALDSARIALPGQDPPPLPYLRGSSPDAAFGLDLRLEVRLNGTLVAQPLYAGMYWSPAQMLAHLTVNGASLRTGDVFASGTVSGAEPDQRGSLLELSWNGTRPLTLDDGSTRGFLEDGDEVSITGWAPTPEGGQLGFGEVRGRIVAAPTDA
jgi:fumarylacetoacetase